MKEKYQYLFKNIGLLTVSNFGSKILVFLLLPIYTSVLTTKDYGTYDLFNTTISLLIPILTVNVSEGVLRFALDAQDNEKTLYSLGIRIIVKSAALVILFCIVNYIFNFSSILKDNTVYFLLLYISTVFYQFLTSFIRGIDKVVVLSVASVFNTVLILIFNILFLIVFRLGLGGYFLANILAAILPSFYLIYKLRSYHIDYSAKKDKDLQTNVINYSRPLILNSLGWWINNAADRYIVIAFCGVATNGIYSVGYKIPSILNIFANIFNQAWVLSSVKSFNEKENDDFFSKIYNSYNMVLVIICSLLIASSKIVAHFLYAKDFFDAWVYVPFLLIANVFGAISGFAGGIFSAAKDSKVYSNSTIVGAIINIVLSLITVYYFGAIGAAISTMISYFVVWVIRIYTMKRYISMSLHLWRDILAYILLLLQSVALVYLQNNIILYPIQIVFIVFCLIIFIPEIKYYIGKISSKFRLSR